MMITLTPEEYRKLTQQDTPRKRKRKPTRPKSPPLQVECGVCHSKIAYAANPNRGVSWGRVKIGGQLVPVHLRCYYTKRKVA